MSISSALCSGVVLAKPVMEARTLYENRKRALAAMGCAIAAFTFIMTALVVATMDIVLQLDGRGFVAWSALSTAACVFIVFAVGFSAAAVGFFPKPPPAMKLPVQELAQIALQALTQSRVAAERERDKISTRARGDLDLDQMPSPAFTH